MLDTLRTFQGISIGSEIKEVTMSGGFWPVLPVKAKAGYKIFELTEELIKQVSISNNFILTYQVCSVCENKVTFNTGNYIRFAYYYIEEEGVSTDYSSDDINFWLSKIKIQLIHMNRYSSRPLDLLIFCSEQCLDLQTLQQDDDNDKSSILF